MCIWSSSELTSTQCTPQRCGRLLQHSLEVSVCLNLSLTHSWNLLEVDVMTVFIPHLNNSCFQSQCAWARASASPACFYAAFCVRRGQFVGLFVFDSKTHHLSNTYVSLHSWVKACAVWLARLLCLACRLLPAELMGMPPSLHIWYWFLPVIIAHIFKHKLCSDTYIHVRTYIHTYVRTYTYITYKRTYIHTYKHTHVHTCIHTFVLPGQWSPLRHTRRVHRLCGIITCRYV